MYVVVVVVVRVTVVTIPGVASNVGWMMIVSVMEVSEVFGTILAKPFLALEIVPVMIELEFQEEDVTHL